MRRALILALLLPLSGCTATLTREHPLYCPLGEQPLQRDTLYFGLARPDGGAVSEAEWQDFARGTLGVVFPDGLTILEAQGQWRGADGAVVREPSRVVIVLHPFEPASEHAIADVIRRYKTRFAQESVLRERAAVCATF